MKNPGTDNILFRWLVAVALSVFFMLVASLYASNQFDNSLLDGISSIQTGPRTRLMILVSFLGNYRFLIPANCLLVGWFFFRRDRPLALISLAIGLSSLGLMNLLKDLFHRQRPPAPLVNGITNFSFPSGHAMMSMAFFGLLIWLAAGSIQHRPLRYFLIGSFSFLILAIGISRVYLRVHYPTDVAGGWAIGYTWLVTCFFAAAQIRKINVPSRQEPP